MELSYPIPANPEFSILESPGYREYRVEKRRRRPSQGRIIVPFFLFCSLAVALYWQSVNFFFSWFLIPQPPLTTVPGKKLSSSSGYTFLVASTVVSCIVFGFFGQVLYGEGCFSFFVREKWQG
jgi:hypothetical protein